MIRNKSVKRLIKRGSVFGAVILSVSLLSISSPAAPKTMPDGSFFDAEYYAENNPDVVKACGTDDAAVMYQHYVNFGKKEGRLPYAGADVAVAKAAAKDTSSYFARSVFIGDSVLAGYRNYLAAKKDSPVSSATFLAAASYSASHALNEKDSLHPIYKGKKQPVWKSIALMDVDQVFIMFGTNDLVVKDATSASNDVITLAGKIKEANPGVKIHIISMSPVYKGTKKGAMNNPTINIYNSLLMEGAAKIGADYIDLNSHLQDANGDLKSRYCSDKYVHQTNASYSEVWDPLFVSYASGNL